MKFFLSFTIFFLASFDVSATTPTAAYNMAKEGNAAIFDVREKDEIKSGMIDTAIWFPKSKMLTDPNWKEDFLKLAKGKRIFLYCKSGRRSEESQKILQKNGIDSENIGGFEQLKSILPTTTPHQLPQTAI